MNFFLRNINFQISFCIYLRYKFCYYTFKFRYIFYHFTIIFCTYQKIDIHYFGSFRFLMKHWCVKSLKVKRENSAERLNINQSFFIKVKKKKYIYLQKNQIENKYFKILKLNLCEICTINCDHLYFENMLYLVEQNVRHLFTIAL